MKPGLPRWRARLKMEPKVGVALAGGLFALSLFILFTTGGQKKTGPDMSLIWYYDLNTNEKYEVKWDGYGPEQFNAQIPPQPAPSGPLQRDWPPPLKKGDPAGVRVYMFACGDCSNEQFIGYLETFPVAIRDMIGEGKATPREMVPNHYWKAVDGEKWVIKDKPEAMDLLRQLAARCPGKRLQECNPRD